jgi:hypothetical protein
LYTNNPKIQAALFLVCLLPAFSAAKQLPTAQDINNFADSAKSAIDTFQQQSFRLRMQHEYSGKFLSSEDRENLRALADAAVEKLTAIAKEQNKLKQQIEDYTGDDWDERYGATGLWRKITSDLYATKLLRYEIDYWRALAGEKVEQLQILKDILAEMERLDLKPPPSQRIRQTNPPPAVQLLRARVYALMAKSEPDYKRAATKEYDDLKTRSDISAAASFRIAIEEAASIGPDEPNQLDTMPQQIAQAGLCDDTELIIAAASLLRRQNRLQAFENMLQLCPQVSDEVGALALADLSDSANGQKPEQVSVFEAQLAAKAAWSDGPQNHIKTLTTLAGEKKFQTPLILYVTALALEDSHPDKSVELMIQTSNLQKSEESPILDITPQELAAQASELAFKLFVENKSDCKTALNAFENYGAIASEGVDDKLKYFNSVVLYQCGQAAKGGKLRRELADSSEGYWRNRARLDLIMESLAQKEISNDIKWNALAETAAFMAGTIETEDCEYADESLVVADEIIDRIEQFQADSNDPTKTAQDCRKLAQFAYDCLDGEIKHRAGLVLAEATIIAAEGNEQVLKEAEKLIQNLSKGVPDNDADYLRCRARLLTEQQKFADAAGLWSSIADILKQEKTPPGDGLRHLPQERSWHWWEAKFYELYCWSKLPDTKAGEVLHTVEVFQNSYNNIPSLWAKKLQGLKAQIK